MKFSLQWMFSSDMWFLGKAWDLRDSWQEWTPSNFPYIIMLCCTEYNGVKSILKVYIIIIFWFFFQLFQLLQNWRNIVLWNRFCIKNKMRLHKDLDPKQLGANVLEFRGPLKRQLNVPQPFNIFLGWHNVLQNSSKAFLILDYRFIQRVSMPFYCWLTKKNTI